MTFKKIRQLCQQLVQKITYCPFTSFFPKNLLIFVIWCPFLLALSCPSCGRKYILLSSFFFILFGPLSSFSFSCVFFLFSFSTFLVRVYCTLYTVQYFQPVSSFLSLLHPSLSFSLFKNNEMFITSSLFSTLLVLFHSFSPFVLPSVFTQFFVLSCPLFLLFPLSSFFIRS